MVTGSAASALRKSLPIFTLPNFPPTTIPLCSAPPTTLPFTSDAPDPTTRPQEACRHAARAPIEVSTDRHVLNNLAGDISAFRGPARDSEHPLYIMRDLQDAHLPREGALRPGGDIGADSDRIRLEALERCDPRSVRADIDLSKVAADTHFFQIHPERMERGDGQHPIAATDHRGRDLDCRPIESGEIGRGAKIDCHQRAMRAEGETLLSERAPTRLHLHQIAIRIDEGRAGFRGT